MTFSIHTRSCVLPPFLVVYSNRMQATGPGCMSNTRVTFFEMLCLKGLPFTSCSFK
uniref:Uncharacterized protein n=1 Tax=Arundo donax TaxID=35708 RepID=A0A0A9A3V5_ARUDO